MSGTSATSTLDIVLKDDVSANARRIADSIEKVQADAKQLDEALSKSGTRDGLQARLKSLGASKTQIEGVAKAWADYAKAQELGSDKSTWTGKQVAAVKNWENVTVASLRAVRGEERARAFAEAADAKKAEDRRKREAEKRIEDAARTAQAEAAARQKAVERASREAQSTAEANARDERRREETAARDARRLAEQQDRDERLRVERRIRDDRILADHQAREHRQAERAAEHARHQEAEAQRRHGFVHMAAGAGASYVSAHSVWSGLERTAEAGGERAHVEVGMQNAGMPAEEIQRARALASRVSRNAPNLSVSEILELHKEARSAVQHPEEVFDLMPDLSKAASVLKGMGAANANIADLVKGGESLGLMGDPKRFHAFLEGQVKSMQVMGRTITTEQIYEAAKYSKSAGATLSDDFLNLTMPSLIQEMHGSSAGDALSSLTKTLRGGLQHKHLPVEKLNQMGLLEDPSQIRRSKSGQIMGYGGKVVGDDLIASDPARFFHEIWTPAAEKMGAVSLADKIKLLSETLPSTAANLGRILIQQEETLKQHQINYKAAPGLDQSVENQRKDPTVGVQSLTASLNDLMAAAANPIMGKAAKAMDLMATAMKRVAAAGEEHPAIAATAGGVAGASGLAVSGWLGWWMAKRARGFLRGGAPTSPEPSVPPEGAAPVEAPKPAEPSLWERIRGRLPAAGTGFAGSASSLGTLAMLSWWASQSDVVHLDDGHLKAAEKAMRENPNGFVRIPGLGASASDGEDRLTRARSSDLPPELIRPAAAGAAPGPATPSAPAAPVSPQVDPASATDALFQLGSLSEETGAKMQTALNVTAKPEVDAGSINAAQAAADRLVATLGQIGALAAAASAAVAGASAGGVNAAVSARRSFNRGPLGATSA